MEFVMKDDISWNNALPPTTSYHDERDCPPPLKSISLLIKIRKENFISEEIKA